MNPIHKPQLPLNSSLFLFVFHSLGHVILNISTYFFIQSELIEDICGMGPAESLLFSLPAVDIECLHVAPDALSSSLCFESERKGFSDVPLCLKMVLI